jgi:sugar/nucleoside kinase (ribokinase family)/fructoselysine-6-P-deglycase FrlB-like protein
LKNKILGAGLVAVDHIFLAKDQSRVTKKIEYLGSAGGGTIPNSLCMLSLLNYNTYFFGITGNDICERIIKEDFREFGVNTDFLLKRGDNKKLKITRQFSHLIYQNGKHIFKKVCLECNNKFTREYQLSQNDVNKKLLQSLDDINLLLLDRANNVTIFLADKIKEKGNKVAFDWDFSTYGKYLKNIELLLSKSNLVKTNDKTFKKYMNEDDDAAIMRWWEKFPENDFLFVTNNEHGVYGYITLNGNRKIFHYKAIPCNNIRDTSGCGDIFFAIITSELLLNEEPLTYKNIEYKINLSQALASLKCTLYGARSLQRTLLNQRLTPKEIFQTADLILQKNICGNSFSPTIGLPKPVNEPFRLSKLNGCKICGNLSLNKDKIIDRLESAPPRMNKSLTRTPWTMRDSFIIGKAYRKKIKNIDNKNALLIGSGGSYSAAIFGETIYLQSLGILAKALTPYEFEGINEIKNDPVLWLISHGGGNTDILGAALHAKKLHINNVNILTSKKSSKLVELANQYKWNNTFIQVQERNFVSIIGFLSQISALAGTLSTEDDLKAIEDFLNEKKIHSFFNTSGRLMERLAHQISSNDDFIQNLHIVGLARGWGWPALVDFESKIVEGGICTIEISELKNYTHGRYINTYGRKNRCVILFKTPNDEELIEYLCKKFKNRVNYYVIQTDEKGIVGCLELLIKSIFLAYYLGYIAKKNILDPKYPPEAKGLYSWEPRDRKGIWKTNKKEDKKNIVQKIL